MILAIFTLFHVVISIVAIFAGVVAVGIFSLLALAVAIFARYRRHLIGYWRPTYVVTPTLSLYFNVFVLIVQAFVKVPALKSLAPTQSESPFKLTQLIALSLFVIV